MQEKIRTLIMAVVFVVCLALIMIGQKNIGVPGLFCIAESTCGCLTIIFGYWTIEENWKKKEIRGERL